MVQLELEALVKFEDTRPAVHPVADSGHARVLLVCMKEGQGLKDHRSTSQVMAHCLKGAVIFYADGVPSKLEAGSVAFVEPNHFHRMEARSESVVLVVMAPHPAREGYPREHLDRIIVRSRSND